MVIKMEERDFAWALRHIKQGKKLQREGWNGKDMVDAEPEDIKGLISGNKPEINQHLVQHSMTEHPAQHQAKLLAEAMMRSKDEIIRKTINGMIGNTWEIEDLKGRLLVHITDDREKYSLDGNLLIEFLPVDREVNVKESVTTITLKQNYRILYT